MDEPILFILLQYGKQNFKNARLNSDQAKLDFKAEYEEFMEIF